MWKYNQTHTDENHKNTHLTHNSIWNSDAGINKISAVFNLCVCVLSASGTVFTAIDVATGQEVS